MKGTGGDLRLVLRAPKSADGGLLNTLIAKCPPLDRNSCYCNILQCGHFSSTSIVAEDSGGALLGSVTGYRLPDARDVLFIWQVAVHPDVRGTGLAKTMLLTLIDRAQKDGVDHLHTTITSDNRGSWALFRAVAQAMGAALTSGGGFDRQEHFAGEHDSEVLVQIGPFHGLSGKSGESKASHKEGDYA